MGFSLFNCTLIPYFIKVLDFLEFDTFLNIRHNQKNNRPNMHYIFGLLFSLNVLLSLTLLITLFYIRLLFLSSVRNASKFFPSIGNNGILSGPTLYPISPKAVFTGIGFTSINNESIRAKYFV